MKFQDYDHVSGADIASAFQQMREQRRFNEILFMADTCHAGSLIEGIRTPGVFGMASSRRDENSYSRYHDHDLGISVIDEFTSATLKFFQMHESAKHRSVERGTTPPLPRTLEDYLKFLQSPQGHMRSTVVHNGNFFTRKPRYATCCC